MKSWLVVGMMVASSLALAQGPGRGQMAVSPEKRAEFRAQRHERLVKFLGLNDADARRVKETLDRIGQRREPLAETIHQNAKIVRDAARGDAQAAGKVDQAIEALFNARAQMAALDREAYNEVSRGLPAEKKARLAIMFARGHKGGPGMGPGKRGAPGMRGGAGMRGQGPGPCDNPECEHGPHGMGPDGDEFEG